MTKRGRTLSQVSRRVLYSLKQKWGREATYYKVGNALKDVDIETGRSRLNITRHQIKKLVTFKQQVISKFEYDIGYLAANKNFTYGGFYQPGDRVAIVAYSDIQGATITMDSYFFVDNKRYNIQRFDILDHDLGWIVHLRNIPGDKGNQIHIKNVVDLLTFTGVQDATI